MARFLRDIAVKLQQKVKVDKSLALKRGTILAVHNLRNRLFFGHFDLCDVPLMISVVDIADRAYLRRTIARAGIKSFLGISGPVVIDSGGFTFMTPGRISISIDNLTRLYQEIGADLYAALDFPPVPGDSRGTRRRKWRKTLLNLEYMLKHLPDQEVIPIIHGHSLGEITQACQDIRRLSDCPKIIGLGGMVPFFRGLMSKERFCYRRPNGSMAFGVSYVADAMAICRAEFPTAHLHVFGAGSATTVTALLALGAHSVDSLAWRRAAGFGTIFLAGFAERTISEVRRIRESRPRISISDHAVLGQCGCPICIKQGSVLERVKALAESYVARAVHNVWTLQKEQAAFRRALNNGSIANFALARIAPRHRFADVVKERLDASGI